MEPTLPVALQCDLAGVPRSTWYRTRDPKEPSKEELQLRNTVDEIYTACPFYGSPRITEELRRRGWIVNHKRIERVMREMELFALFPRRNTSQPHPHHPVYPYLLRGVEATHPNHIWGTDITYIRAHPRWLYLIAILDWYSRRVLSWKIADMMTADVCVEALREALTQATPEIHNSDQGSQFTSEAYTNLLKSNGIAISMDGRGRCFDNIFTERLWRTVKYEEVYLQRYASLLHAKESLDRYFHLYNTIRLHSSLNYKTPAEIYFGG